MHTSSCLGSGLTLPGRHTFPRQHTRQGHCYAARMKALSREEALALLELDRGSSKAELRAAYLERIRQVFNGPPYTQIRVAIVAACRFEWLEAAS